MFPFIYKNANEDDDHLDKDNIASSPKFQKLMAALFYGGSSFAVLFINKAVMLEFDFPFYNFLALFQFIMTSLILATLIITKHIDVPVLDYNIAREIFPISIMFLGNILCGLGGTQSLNLPMFTVLRRFSILLTMIAEYAILNVKPSQPIVTSVLMMVGGALLAAYFDLTFDLVGYCLIFLNNLFTTLNGVWMKRASLNGKVSKMGILFYNSLFSAIIMIIFFTLEHMYISQKQNYDYLPLLTTRRLRTSDLSSATTEPPIIPTLSSSMTIGNIIRILSSYYYGIDSNKNSGYSIRQLAQFKALIPTNLEATAAEIGGVPIPVVPVIEHIHMIQSTLSAVYTHEAWNNYHFLVSFTIAAVMGSILNYSIFLCTTLNSALTTAVIGCLKNVATTYIGMFIFPDYTFNVLNFIGLNISILGSLYYTYVTMVKGIKGYGGG